MTSHPEWNEHTTATEVARTYADRIKGKTILITGLNPHGIGSATALALASGAPALLILLSRTPAKLAAVAAALHAAHPGVRVATVPADLASQASVRAAAAAVAALTPALDLLVHNAAASYTRRAATPEGIERTFGTNHVGPFLLTGLLLPLMVAAAAAREARPGAVRLVNVSSKGAMFSPVRFHDYNFEGKPVPCEEEPLAGLPPALAQCADDGYNAMLCYAQSKTANILFTLELQRRLQGRGIRSYAVHPGAAETEIGRDLDEGLTAQLSKMVPHWKTLDECAATTLAAALDPALDETRGLYMEDCNFATPPHEGASKPELAERLWHLSEELVGEKFPLDY